MGLVRGHAANRTRQSAGRATVSRFPGEGATRARAPRSQFLLKIMTYAVRISSGDPVAVTKTVQRAIHRVDPVQTIFHIATMEEIVSASVQGRRLGAIPRATLRTRTGCCGGGTVRRSLVYGHTKEARDCGPYGSARDRGRGRVDDSVSRVVLYAIGLTCGLMGVIWCGICCRTCSREFSLRIRSCSVSQQRRHCLCPSLRPGFRGPASGVD